VRQFGQRRSPRRTRQTAAWRRQNHRLPACSDRFEKGRVLLPTNAPWLDEYVMELVGFSGTKYDDQVDSTTQALDQLRGELRPYDVPQGASFPYLAQARILRNRKMCHLPSNGYSSRAPVAALRLAAPPLPVLQGQYCRRRVALFNAPPTAVRGSNPLS
jgi:hypothetical protein